MYFRERSSTEEFAELEKRILEAQEKLRRVASQHDLLQIIKVDETGIRWTKQFDEEYKEDGGLFGAVCFYSAKIQLAVNSIKAEAPGQLNLFQENENAFARYHDFQK